MPGPSEAPETRVDDISYNQTTLHPAALLAVLVLGAVMLIVPRRFAVLPMMVLACFVSPAQRIVLAGLDFNLMRIMTLVGWARLTVRNEAVPFRWVRLDTVIVLWAIANTTAYSLTQGSFHALINKLGTSFDCVGMYFLFRALLRDRRDVDTVIVGFIVISVPVAIAFMVEKAIGHNVFSMFGGVPALTKLREGKLRCQGAFAHPIVAGCFWATLMPLFIGRFLQDRRLVVQTALGILCALTIVVLSTSSTPIMGIAVGVVGFAAFFVRRWMRWIRWGIVSTLAGLHVFMKAPVWHLLARIDLVGGSTGYHRYLVIDMAVRYFDHWWLIGVRTPNFMTAEISNDITNQYVRDGLFGGMPSLCLLILTIVFGFKSVRKLCLLAGQDRGKLWFSWSLGVCLLQHTIIFLALTYFGQATTIWYLELAMIGSMLAAELQTEVVVANRPIENLIHFEPQFESYATRH